MSFSPPPTSLAGYALMRGAMAEIATWIFVPSFVLTLIAGLLAIALNRAYQNAGWAWVKLGTGILVLAGSLCALSPIQQEAERSGSAVAGQLDPATITGSFEAERGTLWMLLAVSTANVVLGIWHPRLTRIRAHQKTDWLQS
jgi:hypothetical protein